MKVLVTAASKHGSTREIASAIAEELRNSGADADEKDVSDVSSVEDYDAVVLGSAVYMGSWLPEARDFVERCRAPLSAMPVWLFSSGPLGAEDPQPHDDTAKIAANLGELPARDHRIFVGKLETEGLGLGERMAAKLVKAPTGDFRDWYAIRGWAREIAEELHPPGDEAPKTDYQ